MLVSTLLGFTDGSEQWRDIVDPDRSRDISVCVCVKERECVKNKRDDGCERGRRKQSRI